MNKTRLIEIAANHGWQHHWRPERHVRYRLSGTTQDGIQWQMETGEPHAYSKWTTNSVSLQGEQYIGFSQSKPAHSFSLIPNFISGFFFKRRLKKVLEAAAQEGNDDENEENVMYHLDVQTFTLKEHHYDLFVLDLYESSVRRVFDNEVEQAILNWFAGPGRGRFNNSSLEKIAIESDIAIYVGSRVVEVAAIEQFVELGLMLARKVRKMQTG
jgi:hypothetical protein